MSEETLKRILENFRRYIRQDQKFLLRDLLHTFHPADVASILSHMDEEEVGYLFELLEPEVASEVLREMDEDARKRLLRRLDPERLSEVVGRMESDDAVEVISELPQEVASEVLREMAPKASEEVRELLQHREDTAGRLMAVEVVAVHQDDTVDQAIAAIRKAVDEMGEFYYVYVVDDAGRLVGVLPLARLLVSRSDRKVCSGRGRQTDRSHYSRRCYGSARRGDVRRYRPDGRNRRGHTRGSRLEDSGGEVPLDPHEPGQRSDLRVHNRGV